MNDDFLYRLRRTPPAGFATRLKATLDRQSTLREARRSSLQWPALASVLVCGVTLAVISPDARHLITGWLERAQPDRAAPGAARPGTSVVREPPAPPPTRPAARSAAARPAAKPPVAAARESSPGPAQTRDHFVVVGSPLVLPYALAALETLPREGNGQTRSEVTDFEKGLARFCAGKGVAYPDILATVRKLSPEDVYRCDRGFIRPDALWIGHDALVLARGKGELPLNLNRRALFLALARFVPDRDAGTLPANTYATWQQIDPALPPEQIRFFVAPNSPAWHLLLEIIEPVCLADPLISAIREPERRMEYCRSFRQDSGLVEVRDEAETLRQVEARPGSIGLVNWKAFESSQARFAAASLEGVSPDIAAIQSGTYAGAVPLYLYIKSPQHIWPAPRSMNLLMASLGGYFAVRGRVPVPPPSGAEPRANASAPRR